MTRPLLTSISADIDGHYFGRGSRAAANNQGFVLCEAYKRKPLLAAW